jgi:Uma2 family endonuclease
MTTLAAPAPARVTREPFLAMVDRGLIAEDDRVELLEGVIVTMAPEGPLHAEGVEQVMEALRRALGERARVRAPHPFDAGRRSMPQPDVLVVAGPARAYRAAHPSTAYLAVEVSDSSLAQDRFTKGPIYAAAGVSEFWIVDLRAERVEVHRSPDRRRRRYRVVEVAPRRAHINLVAFPGVSVAVDDLLP